jgi:two-component system, NtrC family, response regulator GlrR
MKKHILCIDDEENILQLLQEALTLKDYRVSTADEPEAAKKVIQRDPPDLIILDLQIEEGDGFVLLEEIKRLGPSIPVLLLTGALFDRNAVRATIEKKVSCYLDKTASLSTILSEIQRLLEGASAATAGVR